MTDRPWWDEYFMTIARAVAARGDCSRQQVGCVLVDVDQRIVSTGYNGTPPGDPSCLAGDCPAAPGNGPDAVYSNCIAVHAEQNAVAYADRTRNAITAYVTKAPCNMCDKLLRAAGIERIVHG